MSQNLKAFLQEKTSYTAEQLATMLCEQIPGRGVGDRYVVGARQVARNSFVVELDDNSQFKMTCEKLH